MKQILFYLLIVIFCSCSENNVRYPLNKGKKTFLSNSATRNKILLAREELMIRKSADKDSLFTFYNSEKGFLYAYMLKRFLKINLFLKREQNCVLLIKLKI